MAAGAIEWDLVAFKNVPFLYEFVKEGHDWSGGTYKLEVRTTKGSTGSALISLTGATAGSQGISASYDAGYIDPDTSAVVGATNLLAQIDEATLEGLAYATDAADDLVLYYDLHVTPPGEEKRVFAYGTFTVKPGVTI